MAKLASEVELISERFNKLDKLQVISFKSERELLALLRKIRLPTQIVSIYHDGNKHFCWIYSDVKIREKING